jgi:hypothetical protein
MLSPDLLTFIPVPAEKLAKTGVDDSGSSTIETPVSSNPKEVDTLTPF